MRKHIGREAPGEGGIEREAPGHVEIEENSGCKNVSGKKLRVR